MRTLILAALLLASPALADEPCGDYAATAKGLSDLHAERRTAQALTATGEIIELWESRDGATWTLLRVKPDGTTCLVAEGTQWTPAAHRYDGRPL